MRSALYFTTEHALEADAPRIGRDQAFGVLDGARLPWWSSASFIYERLRYAAHGSINVDRWFEHIPEAARAATLTIVRREFEDIRGRSASPSALYEFAFNCASALGRCVYETQEDEIDRSIRRARAQ